MLTEEQKELFQKDKYELVDIIIRLRKNLNPERESKIETPSDKTIKNALNKLNKEMSYGNKEESKTNRTEEEC